MFPYFQSSGSESVSADFCPPFISLFPCRELSLCLAGSFSESFFLSHEFSRGTRIWYHLWPPGQGHRDTHVHNHTCTYPVRHTHASVHTLTHIWGIMSRCKSMITSRCSKKRISVAKQHGCWKEYIWVRFTIHLQKIWKTEMHLLTSWKRKSWTQQHKDWGSWKKTSTLQGTNQQQIYSIYIYIYIHICIWQLAAACGLQETRWQKVSTLQHTADCGKTCDKDHSLKENTHTATHYCLLQPVGSCVRLWRKDIFIVFKKGFQNRTKGHSLE